MSAQMLSTLFLAALVFCSTASASDEAPQLAACQANGASSSSCQESPNGQPGQPGGLALFQFSRLNGRLEFEFSESPNGTEAGAEAPAPAPAEGSGNTTAAANATNESGNTSVTTSAPEPEGIFIDGCETRKDPRAQAWFAETSPEGTPCMFGADPRDESGHCIFEDGIYGSNGWCFTAMDRSMWGSCNEKCPLYGDAAKLGKKVDTVAKVVKKVKKMLAGKGGADANSNNNNNNDDHNNDNKNNNKNNNNNEDTAEAES